jgi:mRNA-degrading endonuclease RelE of RelBE toxin-antitoxin system
MAQNTIIMEITYFSPFRKFVKKANKPLVAKIEDEVKFICSDTSIGTKKAGDLKNINIYKFKFNRQEYLIAYTETVKNEIGIIAIDFFKVGTHENFYNELKKYLKEINL